jgi:preprotein translocase SecE subunit
MAEAKKPSTKKLVVKKKRETVRERADKSAKKADKAPRIRKLASSAAKPVGKVGGALKKEYTPLKTGNSKVGKVLGRKSRLTPLYFVQAFKELKAVTWPSRKSAAKLTLAVFIFAFGLATIIRLIDLGFDKLFKDVILK